MLRASLALCLIVSPPLWAQSPETERVSAERSFGQVRSTVPDRDGSAPEPPPVPDPAPVPGTEAPPRSLPPLDFKDVVWPPSLNEDDRKAFGIALNVSGSFEGDDGWDNITGNFDGQGLSLGLLNQCLGQGSLQPLMIGLRTKHPAKFKLFFSPAHLKSLNGMLDRWRRSGGPKYVELRRSLLDEPVDGEEKAASPNQASVDWAKANLYKGGAFVPSWKTELQAMAKSPEYVSLQIAAAHGYHLRALEYEAEVGVREFRAYLMMFDVVVQNGSFYPEDLSEYAQYAQAHPEASSEDRLLKLLELRLRHVRPQYVKDVRARKGAIVRGQGVVHGESRDFPKEYSFDPLWAYK